MVIELGWCDINNKPSSALNAWPGQKLKESGD